MQIYGEGTKSHYERYWVSLRKEFNGQKTIKFEIKFIGPKFNILEYFVYAMYTYMRIRFSLNYKLQFTLVEICIIITFVKYILNKKCQALNNNRYLMSLIYNYYKKKFIVIIKRGNRGAESRCSRSVLRFYVEAGLIRIII